MLRPARWFLVIGLVLICVSSWEMFWRARGFVPGVSDDAPLWALARHQANQMGESAVVLVGSSRMQMDLHREAFSEATGWPPAIQLAVVLGPSIPVLQNLARDPDFRGIVLCEVAPQIFFVETPTFDRMLDDYIRVFDELTLSKQFEERLLMWLQYSTVSRLPDLAPGQLWKAWKRGYLPHPVYNADVSPYRYRAADFNLIPDLPRNIRSAAALQRSKPPRPMLPDAIEARLLEAKQAVSAIQERGGHVIFIRLPASMFVLKLEQRWWKREDYWEKLVAATTADTIHFEDHKTLANLKPQDGHHLGRHQAIAFSRSLGRLLVQKGLAPGADTK